MRWRKWNYYIHRDLGFLCIGLTIIYAVSGILVNHTSHDFNPNYTIEKISSEVRPLGEDVKPDMEYVKQVLSELGEAGAYRNVAMLSTNEIRIFVDGNTIDVNLYTGKVMQEKISRKPVMFEINYLHLNKEKRSWTWIADIYAVALTLLALTGLLMIRGKNKVRGVLLTVIGFAIPAICLVLYL